ncbi:MAG: NADH-quinone oxidoreductase subunit J, partial [Verrucomicrobiae bacterium]|nr:NADH-quinone oxidoreductase subunit J [Verrucomicrobiae bacterium]
LFFTLRAEFLGAVQVIIYVGAIAILILFVTMLVQQAEDQAKPRALFGASGLFGAVTAFGVAGVILISLFKESFVRGAESALEKSQDKLPSMPVRALGEAMMTPYVIPFEIVSILLTAALVGAIVLALEKGAPDSSSNSGGES